MKQRSLANFQSVAAKREPVAAPVTDQEAAPVAPGDPLDDLLQKTSFLDAHKQRGLYIRSDLDAVLTRMAKKGGKGAKTTIVNEALERLFKEKGWI